MERILFCADAHQRGYGADGPDCAELLYGDLCKQLFRLVRGGGDDRAADDPGVYHTAETGDGKPDRRRSERMSVTEDEEYGK